MRPLSQTLRDIPQAKAEEIQEYLAWAADSVKSIDSVRDTLNPISMAIEVRATRKAHSILTEILSGAMQFVPFDRTEKDPKDSFEV